MIVASNSLRAPLLGSLHLPSPAICFAVTCTVLLGPWIGFYLLNPFGFDSPLRDSWHHVAVLRELMIDPFTPSNPHIPTDEGSRYFTPLNVLAALLGRACGLDAYRLFDLMGVMGLLMFATGCWAFGRKYFVSPWAPLALLLCLMFAWGLPTAHAGFHNYATWLSSAAYPSSSALALGLFLWTLTLGQLERPTLFGLAGMALLSATVFLGHQLSGAFMIAGAGSFAIFRTEAALRAKLLCIAALCIGGVMTLAWPYFSLVDVFLSTGDNRWQSAFAERNYVSTALIAASVSFIGVLGFRKPSGSWRLELIVPAIVFFAGYAVLQLVGNPVAHRLPPGFIIFCQLGLVWLVLERSSRLQGSPHLRLGAAMAAALMLYASATGAISARLSDFEFRTKHGSMRAIAQEIAADLPPDSVSYATDSVVFPLQSTGRRVVSIPRPEPAAPSLPARQEATDRFFAIDTGAAERGRLIERWHATDVAFRAEDVGPIVASRLRALGPSRRYRQGIEVVRFANRTAVGGVR